MQLINYIEEHPKVSLSVGIIHLFTAHSLTSFRIPVIIMQTFQLGAWIITIAVGLITIHGFIKKQIKNRGK